MADRDTKMTCALRITGTGQKDSDIDVRSGPIIDAFFDTRYRLLYTQDSTYRLLAHSQDSQPDTGYLCSIRDYSRLQGVRSNIFLSLKCHENDNFLLGVIATESGSIRLSRSLYLAISRMNYDGIEIDISEYLEYEKEGSALSNFITDLKSFDPNLPVAVRFSPNQKIETSGFANMCKVVSVARCNEAGYVYSIDEIIQCLDRAGNFSKYAEVTLRINDVNGISKSVYAYRDAVSDVRNGINRDMKDAPLGDTKQTILQMKRRLQGLDVGISIDHAECDLRGEYFQIVSSDDQIEDEDSTESGSVASSSTKGNQPISKVMVQSTTLNFLDCRDCSFNTVIFDSGMAPKSDHEVLAHIKSRSCRRLKPKASFRVRG